MADHEHHPHDNHDDRATGPPEPELAEVETILRELTVDELDLVEPPASVWDGIAVRIDELDELGAAPDTATTDNVASIDVARRRRSTVNIVMAAAAAVLLVAIAAAVFLPNDDQAEVLATADLTFDPESFDPLGEGTRAEARLVEVDDQYEIEIDHALLPSDLSDDTELELWLIEANDEGEIVDIASVAVLADELPAAYPVPSSIDTETHRIVDISVEPDDGDASHSGRSILRGVLDA
jgi:hypothetical protein